MSVAHTSAPFTGTAAPPAAAVRPAIRAALAGLALFTLLVSANLATPLFPLLEVRLGFGPVGTTIAFSSYVLSLIAGLVIFTRFADVTNRRTVLVTSLLIASFATAWLAYAPSLLWFILGRALQGVAIACATGIASGALRALCSGGPPVASRLTLVASAGGVAMGPIIGGALSQVGDPVATPFAVVAIMLVLLVPAIILAAPYWACEPPEPAPRAAAAQSAAAPASHDGRRTRVGPAAQVGPGTQAGRQTRTFWHAAAMGFLSFTVFGFCLSLAPSFFSATLGVDSRAAIGVLAAITLATSALAQLLPLHGAWRFPGGLLLLMISMGALAWGGAVGSAALVIGACAAAGIGQGIAFATAFGAATAAVSPAQHGSTVTKIYIVTYLGSAIPVLALGGLTEALGISPAVSLFAVVTAAGCGALLAACLLTRRAGSERRPAH